MWRHSGEFLNLELSRTPQREGTLVDEADGSAAHLTTRGRGLGAGYTQCPAVNSAIPMVLESLVQKLEGL